jgi:Anti-sigma factor NepR
MHSSGTTAAQGGSCQENISEELQEVEGNSGRLETSAQALIGQQLKAVYGEIVREPIPDRLLKLIEELERKEDSR